MFKEMPALGHTKLGVILLLGSALVGPLSCGAAQKIIFSEPSVALSEVDPQERAFASPVSNKLNNSADLETTPMAPMVTTAFPSQKKEKKDDFLSDFGSADTEKDSFNSFSDKGRRKPSENGDRSLSRAQNDANDATRLLESKRDERLGSFSEARRAGQYANSEDRHRSKSYAEEVSNQQSKNNPLSWSGGLRGAALDRMQEQHLARLEEFKALYSTAPAGDSRDTSMHDSFWLKPAADRSYSPRSDLSVHSSEPQQQHLQRRH